MQRLRTVVARAHAQGYPIKIAIIGTRSDLGEAYRFWNKPRAYARSLGRELAFRGPLLVVMPSGIGLFGAEERQPQVSGVAVGNNRDLVGVAVATVAELARVSAPPPTASRSRSPWRDRLIVGAAATATLLVLLATRIARR